MKAKLRKTIIEFNTRRYPGIVKYNQVPFRLEVVRRLVGKEKPKKVCDIGCSDGILGGLLIKDGHDVFGVDVSAPALAIAKRRGVKVFKNDLESDSLPFENGSFDVVVSSETIAYIYDTDRLFEEARRILKKGGLFVITTANPLSLGRRLSYLVGVGAFMEADLVRENSGVMKFFTRESLSQLLKRYRFRPVAFTSDQINFEVKGKLHSRALARVFPSLGSAIIVSAKKLG